MGELLVLRWSSWGLSCFLVCMYLVNAGCSDTSSASEVGVYMLIKISGKLQAAVLCLSQTRSTLTCWVHQSWRNQAEQDNTDLRGCRNAHAKYTLSIRRMEWCFNRSLLLGISHVGFFCSGGFDSVVCPALKTLSAGSPKMCIFTDTHISGFFSNLSRQGGGETNKKAIIVRWLWAYLD